MLQRSRRAIGVIVASVDSRRRRHIVRADEGGTTTLLPQDDGKIVARPDDATWVRIVRSKTSDLEVPVIAAKKTSIPLWSTVAAVVLTAYSVLKPPRDSATGRELAIEMAIVLAVAAITFTLVRRVERQGRVALALAILGLLSVALFFLGIISVLFAGAAAQLALEARRRTNSRAATVALALAPVTIVLSILIAIAS
jgi:hypothetical protein